MEVEIKNATIESALISSDDRGFLDCWVTLDYGGCSQGFGGYTLYLPKSFTHHELMSIAGHHLFRCMEVAGVGRWEQMEGRTVRVRTVGGMIEAVGHITKDDWYCPKEDFTNAKK